MKLKIKRLDKEIELPAYQHSYDAAFDLRSSENKILRPGCKEIVKTGLAMAVPEGYAGLIWDRSGLAAKHSLHVMAGVIDAGYRGEIGVVMINLGEDEFQVEKNMRIAQLLVQSVATPDIVETEELDETSRNKDGFGSTGLK